MATMSGTDSNDIINAEGVGDPYNYIYLQGGKGSDLYLLDNQFGVVEEKVGEGYDVVQVRDNFWLSEGSEVEVINFLGSKRGNLVNIHGNSFAQTIIGSANEDYISGGGGGDVLIGLGGDDYYFVSDIRDQVFEMKQGGIDRVEVNLSYSLAAGQEIETLYTDSQGNKKAIKLTGNEFEQEIRGSMSSQVIDGKGGADVLSGGGGKDTFVFSTKLGKSNVDIIKDFSNFDDQMNLEDLVFSGLKAGKLAAKQFKALDFGKIDADDRIIYKQSTGELMFDSDGSGKKAAVVFAVIENHAKIDHTDFFIV